MGLGAAAGSSAGAVVISRGIQRWATGRRKGSLGSIMNVLYNIKYLMSMIRRAHCGTDLCVETDRESQRVPSEIGFKRTSANPGSCAVLESGRGQHCF